MMAVAPDAVQSKMHVASQLAGAGNLAEAKGLYEQVLQESPDNFGALMELGVICLRRGDGNAAHTLLCRAVAVNPASPQAHNLLGVSLQGRGDLTGARKSYETALALNSGFGGAYNNLGMALTLLGETEQAVESYRKAIAITPNDVNALNNLAAALTELGRFDEAIDSYEKAIALRPGAADIHDNFGLVFQGIGDFERAAACHRKAVSIDPGSANSHLLLGRALQKSGDIDQAAKCYRRTIEINPGSAIAYNNLSTVLTGLGRYDESRILLENALALGGETQSSGALRAQSEGVETVGFQKGRVSADDFALPHSAYLLMLQYMTGQTAESLYRKHRAWNERHGAAFKASWPNHRNSPDPDRPLRVGFVSPDLGRHPIGYFTLGVFENLPKDRIETVVYSDRIPDDLTARFKACAKLWRDTRTLSDQLLAETILADGIDILIDLTGHTGENRLMAVARKPAPLQVSWAGYVSTTGLDAIDYLLSDSHSTLVEEEPFYSEKILRMPDSWLCYAPPDYAPDVGPLPARANGHVTFCSFNNPSKNNADVLSLWAKILNAVPDARLVLKYGGYGVDSVAESVRRDFAAAGGDVERLVLEGASPHRELLERYNGVDIALDPFPYSGGLTTCEALWMGVPVITLPGATFASRHSQSFLSTVGLADLVADDRDEYVRLALDLAGDIDRLSALRAGLRDRVSASPLCDAASFARHFADLMRDIWRKWCAERPRR